MFEKRHIWAGVGLLALTVAVLFLAVGLGAMAFEIRAPLDRVRGLDWSAFSFAPVAAALVPALILALTAALVLAVILRAAWRRVGAGTWAAHLRACSVDIGALQPIGRARPSAA